MFLLLFHISVGCSLFNLEKPLHGISSNISIWEEDYLFNNCPKNFKIGHYHSWIVAPIAPENELKTTAIDEAKNCMALTHKTFDVKGVQFHPESILTEFGKEIFKNWLEN